MIPYKFYKHRRFIDVCFKPMLVNEDVNSITIYGQWYNLTHGYYMGLTEYITIKKEDIKYWEEVEWNNTTG